MDEQTPGARWPLRWHPGLPRTVRGPHALQLGVGDGALVLDGLGSGDWELLAALDRSPTDAQLRAVAARAGVAPERVPHLLGMLRGAGALVQVPPGESRPPGPGRADPWPGAAARAGLEPVASLAGAEVAVVGGGGLGVVLAVALAAAGAARSALVDDATVEEEDVVPGGATHADVGRRATHVAAEAVHRLRPDVRTACPTDPDLVVLVSPHVPDAPAAVPLVQSGTLHLPVVVTARHVVVGPLVVPGRGACLHCLDLHHRDLDPGWADAVRQLRRDFRRVPGPDPATAAVTAGLTTLLAGAPDAVGRAGVEVRLTRAGTTSWHRWSPHPGCGCVGWPDPGPGVAEPGRAGGASDPPAPGGRAGATMAA